MEKQTVILSLIVLYILFIGFVVEPNSLVVTKYQIKEPGLSGARIVFLSDLHLKKYDNKRLNKILNTIEKNINKDKKPNLILLGGDYLQGKEYNESIMSTFATKISALSNVVAGSNRIYAVLGESDYQIDGSKIKNELIKAGIVVVENSSKMTSLNGRTTSIVGIADIKTRQPDIHRAFSKSRGYKIVLTHNPDLYYDIIDEATLILAGHTHGGQVVIPYTPAFFVDSRYGAKLASGLINDTNNKMIISKGIGTTGLPIRINCKPEIVVVDFVN